MAPYRPSQSNAVRLDAVLDTELDEVLDDLLNDDQQKAAEDIDEVLTELFS